MFSKAPGYIRHMSYDVYAPGDKPLKRIVVRDEVPGTLSSTPPLTGPNQVTFITGKSPMFRRMFDEPSMPPYEIVSAAPVRQHHARLAIRLEMVLGCLQAASRCHHSGNEKNRRGAHRARKSNTDRKRIKAIFYHVAQKIRYMGLTPEKDRPGFEPHDVKLTFDNKYGVCRDKAALLVSMLRGRWL